MRRLLPIGRGRRQEATPLPQPIPESVRRSNWNREIASCAELHSFVARGQADNLSSALYRVKSATDNYLRGQGEGILPVERVDNILQSLIAEQMNPTTKGVALIACLHALSIPRSHAHIVQLQHTDKQQYLRMLVAAKQTKADLLPQDVAVLVQHLHQLLLPRPESPFDNLNLFRQIVEIVGNREPSPILPVHFVQCLLVNIGFGTGLQNHVAALLSAHEFFSAFRSVAWLRSVASYPNTQATFNLLDVVLPSWRYLRLWEPKIARITQLEKGGFNESQTAQLASLLVLEGPDTITGEKATLGAVDLAHRRGLTCSLSSMEAEAALELLCRCHQLGPNTVGLFIDFCVDREPDDVGAEFLEELLSKGDDMCSHYVRRLLEASEESTNLAKKLRSFTSSVPRLQVLRPHWYSRPPLGSSITQIQPLMVRAQQALCLSLATGTGRHIGMLIYSFGRAILGSFSIHQCLATDFLTQLRQHPSESTLTAIFERIRTTSKSQPIAQCRFKSYIASALGGRTLQLDQSITPAAIQNEIRFWREVTDTTRKDLAEALGRISTIRYSLYTSWLIVILSEKDDFMRHVRHIMMREVEHSALALADYLATRRNHNQMLDETWLLLFASLIEDRGPTYLRTLADSKTATEWLKLITNLSTLVQSVRGRLPEFGAGLSQSQLDWWDTLRRKAGPVQMLLGHTGQSSNPTWLYFPQSPERLTALLDTLARRGAPFNIYARTTSLLSHSGSNILELCDCIEALTRTSPFGEEVFKRQLSFHESRRDKRAIKAGIRIWKDGAILTASDKASIVLLETLLSLPIISSQIGHAALKPYLLSEHESLIERAGEFERVRLKLHHNHSERLSTLLRRLGIENASTGRARQGSIPSEIADAVETISGDEYEISFPLTGLNDLQRTARGVPPKSRLLLLRLKLSSANGALILNRQTQFCIHYAPNDEGGRFHRYWDVSRGTFPNGNLCTTRPAMFTYYIARRMQQILGSSSSDLGTLYTRVTRLISSSPDTCLYCTRTMPLRLWKATACSRDCSVSLRNAPLEVRLHNLLINPKAIDLLLTSVYHASVESPAQELLPACPVQLSSMQAVIDSMPSLDTLQTVTDLRSAIQGNDGLGRNREALLSWLCLRFRGLMLSVPDGFKVPSLGLNTEQFILPNSSHDHEQAFNARYTLGGSSTVVFHGTRASRLFPILTTKLRIARGGPLQLNGAAYGAGIYCGHDPSTSWGFAGTTGQSWRNSALRNFNVMLGCELTPATSPTHGNAHVITDEDRIMVRYVFLLPQSFRPPIRAHVETAMMAGIATLRSGLST